MALHRMPLDRLIINSIYLAGPKLTLFLRQGGDAITRDINYINTIVGGMIEMLRLF